jgi:divalent metal cation (Fe/Co/Zn/Cd) transporter
MHGIIGAMQLLCCSFIGISVALLLGKGYESADDWAALFASGFILFNAYLIFRPHLVK